MNKFVNLSNREHGQLPARTFSHRLVASEDLIPRLGVFRKLEKHTRNVTSLCFNAEGDILVSGAADKAVILWDWESGQINLSFNSGHKAAVFQAKIMPYSNNRSIVTSAFRQLRHAQIDEQGGVTSKDLGLHLGKCLPLLAIQPGSPHIFYFSNQDGIVNQCDLRADQTRSTGRYTHVFYTEPKKGEADYNAIAIDPRNPNLLAVVGRDQYARLYDIRKYRSNNINNQPIKYFCPSHLIGEKKKKQITSLAFSQQRELLMSYGDEFIYLFTQDMGYDGSQEPQQPFPLPVNITPRVFKAPYLRACNFFGPNCEYVVGSSGIGGIFIWRKRDGRLVREIITDNNGVLPDIEPHPHTMVLASCASNYRVKIWNVA